MGRAARCTKTPIYVESVKGSHYFGYCMQLYPVFTEGVPPILGFALELPLGTVREFMFYKFMTSTEVRIAHYL